MTKPITFKQPPKVKGQAQVQMQLAVDSFDKQIVKTFAAEQSQTAGIKVSMGNVLMTAFYQQWPELRKKKRQLEREAHARK
ncbi:hypothetical protein [Pseudarthrobacter sp. H2]|uniref:hypothetical protein n=1 Tax=Pseudarthrobacter sp. H2 TaxID=3418415 RepID=UPI003CED8A74